jgi:hypothetical protein
MMSINFFIISNIFQSQIYFLISYLRTSFYCQLKQNIEKLANVFYIFLSF